MQQMPMNAPPHHLQQNGPSHLGTPPNHLQHHPPMGPHGKRIKLVPIRLFDRFNLIIFRWFIYSPATWRNANAANATNGLPGASNAAKCEYQSFEPINHTCVLRSRKICVITKKLKNS